MNFENLEILKKVTVLYVEDDRNIRDELVKILERFVGKLLIAENGAEGLLIFKEQKPDLVVTDLRMPVMNGMEMSKKIKELNKETPVIVTTAHNESGYLIDAMNLGLDRYILKPVDISILLDALEKNTRTLLFKREKEAREAEFQFILDLNPNFIMLVDRNKIEFVNRTFLDYLGFESLKQFQNFKYEQDDNGNLNELKDCIYDINLLLSTEFLTEKVMANPRLCVCKNGKKESRIFSLQTSKIPESEKLIITFSDVTRLEMEIEILKQMAKVDALTGIGNRRYFDEELELELDRSHRYGSQITFILLDIDHFKKINDTYGHTTGDIILKQLAQIITSNIRKHDSVYRIGGEEFGIIAPGLDADSGFHLAEKIRHAIEQHEFELTGKLTCSLGLTIKLPQDSKTSLFERADKALYLSKNEGRNKVSIIAV